METINDTNIHVEQYKVRNVESAPTFNFAMSSMLRIQASGTKRVANSLLCLMLIPGKNVIAVLVVFSKAVLFDAKLSVY